MGIRDGLNSLMEGLVNEWIIVPFAENIGHDTPVTEIPDGTQIELMYLNALIPFELRHIGQPFLIRFLCMELAVQEVGDEIPWIFSVLSARRSFSAALWLSFPDAPENFLGVKSPCALYSFIHIRSR